MTDERLRKIALRHKQQLNYAGRQEPTKATHKTGIVPTCASCHRVWPCDASIAVAAALAATPALTLDTLDASQSVDQGLRGRVEVDAKALAALLGEPNDD